MALSKTARIWTLVIAIPLSLIIILLIGLKLYFTSDRLKAMVLPKLEEATHRHVSVAGLSLDVFPSIGISIDSLRISNPEGSKFARDEFVSVDHFAVDVKLFPLLTGNVSVSSVTVDHPVVYLETTKDGRKNFSSGESAAKKATSGSSGGIGGGLLVSDLRVNDATIEMVNYKFDSRMLFDGLTTRAEAASASGQQAITITQNSTIDKVSYGTTHLWFLDEQPFTATSKITYAIDKDVLTLDDVQGHLRDLPLTVKGTIADLQQDVNQLDLTVTAPGASMEQLLSIIPPDFLKKTKGLKAAGDVKFSVVIKGPSSDHVNPATSAQFSVTDGSIQYASLPKSISGLTIQGSFDKPSAPITATGLGSFAIDRYSAKVGSNTLAGSLKVSSFDDPVVAATFNGMLDLGEVKDFYPLEEGSSMGGTMKADVTVNGKAKKPESLNAKGQIEFRNVTIQSAGSPKPIKNLNGTITFNNQTIDAKQLSLNVGESDLALGFHLRNYLALAMPGSTKDAGKPTATVSLTSHQLRMADIMSDSTAAPAKKTAAPAATPKAAGILPGIDMTADVAIDKLVTNKFTFNNAKGSLAMSDGIVNLKSFNVNAFQGSIQSTGTLDLRDPNKRPFNLQLGIKDVSSNDLLSKFTSFGNYLFGKLTMNTALKGDLNDTMGLDTRTLSGDGLTKILEGKLSGFPVTQKLSEFTGSPQLKDINFKDWTNAFSIANGRCNVKDLKINAGTTSLAVDGSQGLDGTLDYALTVKLPADASSKISLPGVGAQLIQYLKDKDGRLNLPFHVGGTTTSPSLQLNTASAEELAKKGVKDKLQNTLQEGLKNLFKKP